jgi:glycosyltransferase involved in cell wall biosynthesis
LATVTVIIPTFNRTKKLIRAIGSVFDQSYKDWAIIVVDDASTEDISAAVSGFDSQKIKLLRHERTKGANAARNTGWRAANSPFIAFLDSDDIWLPDKLSRQMNVFDVAGSDLGMVYSWFAVKGTNTPFFNVDPEEIDFTQLLVNNSIGTFSTAVVRRRVLEEVHGLDEDLPSCQDWDLWLRLYGVTRISGLAEILTWLDVEGNRISNNPVASLEGHKLFFDKHRNSVAELPKSARSRFHLNLARVFFFKRSMSYAAQHAWEALDSDPMALFKVFGFLLQRFARRTGKIISHR